MSSFHSSILSLRFQLPRHRLIESLCFAWCGLLTLGIASLVRADVAVVSNRFPVTVTFQLVSPGVPDRTMSLAVGDSRPLFFSDKVHIRYGSGLMPQGFILEPGSAYFFHQGAEPGQLTLEKIGLGASDTAKVPRLPWFSESPDVGNSNKIAITIAVDDDEPTLRSIWEPRYRKRVEQASEILRQHCGLELEIKSVVTWDSEDKVRNFLRTLAEFEKEVPRRGVDLVIGFTSQYELKEGRRHLGGSRGTLYPYILLTEHAPNVREPERLQLMVHELGHFLGASHSPEPQSVMRPVLTRGLDRRIDSRIQFDPVNTLLMGMMGEEIRQRGVRSFREVSWQTKSRMTEIYDVLRKALPNDPAAAQYRVLTDLATTGPIQLEVRATLRELLHMAKLEHARAEKKAQEEETPFAVSQPGDILTARYVREAAAIVADLHSDDPARTLLVALGIFFDDEGKLAALPVTHAFAAKMETTSEHQQREEVLGEPTMRGRRDTLKHFFLSAYLTATLGNTTARAAGLAKEVFDANGGTGFSFADMAANRAGIVFAEKLLDGTITLEQLEDDFRVERYLPEITDLEEGLQAAQLATKWQNEPAGLEAELSRIERRILQLPVYAN